MNQDRPKIGLALSGGSGRAITHIGVLEVFRENNIPVDILTAASSGTIIAAAYAAGTMDELKADWMKLNKKFLLSLVGIDKTWKGMFQTEKAVSWLTKYMGSNKNFEDVKPALGFVCADIVSGQPILLSLGDIIKASQASCAVPGLFEPVEWGNKLLVDGGLFSIIPTSQAKDMGADIVIGVDIATTRYMFSRKFLRVRKGYNFVRNSMPVRLYAKLHGLIDRFFSKSIDLIFYNQSDILEQADFSKPGMFTILGRALDISMAQSEKREDLLVDCHVLISPKVKHLGKADFDNAQAMYEEGRRAALAAVPEIRRTMNDYAFRTEARLKLKPRTAVS